MQIHIILPNVYELYVFAYSLGWEEEGLFTSLMIPGGGPAKQKQNSPV